MAASICITCKNCTRCSWRNGKPIKGWIAKPIIRKDTLELEDNCVDIKRINTYQVLSCPQYKPYDIVIPKRFTYKLAAQELNISLRTMFNRVKRIGEKNKANINLTDKELKTLDIVDKIKNKNN